MTKKDIPFENAMEKLEKIVTDLEDSNLSLDKSLDNFEEGMQLAKICEDALNQASGRVEKIMKDFSGKETIVEIPQSELNINSRESNDI